MTRNLDHSRVRRLARLSRGLREYPQDETMEIDTGRPGSRPLGWRTQWDGEPFPVTVTMLDARESDMTPQDDEIRPIDYNGHVPAECSNADTNTLVSGGFAAVEPLTEIVAPLGAVLAKLAGQ